MEIKRATTRRLRAFCLSGRFIPETDWHEYLGGILLIPDGGGYVSWFGDWDSLSKFFGERELEELDGYLDE